MTGAAQFEGLILLFGFATWIASAKAAEMIAARKDAPNAGLICGILFGPIGVLFAIALERRPLCPYCLERINRGARVCGHCTRVLPTGQATPPEIPQR